MPRDVPLSFALLSFFAWGVVARAVLVYTRVLPPTCGGCGLKLERRYLGQRVCGCRHEPSTSTPRGRRRRRTRRRRRVPWGELAQGHPSEGLEPERNEPCEHEHTDPAA